MPAAVGFAFLVAGRFTEDCRGRVVCLFLSLGRGAVAGPGATLRKGRGPTMSVSIGGGGCFFPVTSDVMLSLEPFEPLPATLTGGWKAEVCNKVSLG